MSAVVKLVEPKPYEPQAPALRERRVKLAQVVIQTERKSEAAQSRYSRAIADGLDDPKVDVAAARIERDRSASELEDARASLRQLDERIEKAEAVDALAAHGAVRDEIAKRSDALNVRAEAAYTLLYAGHVELHAIADEMAALFRLAFPGGPTHETRDLQLAGQYLVDGTTHGGSISQITARVRNFTDQL
jgi:hypothetical protein